jgi:hypothetical protein
MKRRLFLTGLFGAVATGLSGVQLALQQYEVFGISFTKELMEDLQGMHRLDAVDEIAKILADQIDIESKKMYTGLESNNVTLLSEQAEPTSS